MDRPPLTPPPVPASLPHAAPDGRIASLDIVRGVAVLGIVVANIIGLGQPMTAYTYPGAFLTPPTAWDDGLWGAQLVLIDGKLRALFTLLFGSGLVLFLRRAAARDAAGARGPGAAALLARRLGWLALFGFAHWLLLWRGDILMSYALAGILVMWLAPMAPHKQLALGLAAYLAGAAVRFAASVPLAATAQGNHAAGSGMAAMREAMLAAESADLSDGQAEAGFQIAGDYAGMVAHTLHTHLSDLPIELGFAMLEAAPLALIGMGLAGLGLVGGAIPRARLALWGGVLWAIGTAATLPIAIWAAAGGVTYWDSFAAFNGWLPVPQLLSALGLMALLFAWAEGARGWLARRLGEAGRCAFTNYIGTSALALVIFPAWGLGLFGTLNRVELYALVPVFWAVMLAWPAWWLAHHRQGPLEWLWRRLTYGAAPAR